MSGGANIEIEPYHPNDTFYDTTLVQRDTYMKGQVLAVKTDEYYDLINQYDWDTNLMYRIMQCESKGDPNAHNFSHKTKDDSWGLLQINRYGKLDYRPGPEWLVVPENNIDYAYEIFLKEGYEAWGCYKKVN